MTEISFDPEVAPEVQDYIKRKGYRPSFNFQEVWQEEHAYSFTVAKATGMDVLRTIREEMDRAIRQGIPFRKFQKTITPRLQRLGWWGEKVVRDPATDKEKKVRLGSPRRLRTIYEANLRSAHAAGQWQRAQRTKKLRPFIEYGLGPSRNHRDAHVAWAGTILPVDDAFWRQHWPPNGWGCRCWVAQISRRVAKRRGGETPRPSMKRVEHRNKRTGEVRRVPIGVDPAWASNPGRHRQRTMQRMLSGKMDALPHAFAETAARDIVGSKEFARLARGERTLGLPLAALSDDLRKALGTQARAVQMSAATVAKQRRRHPEVRAEDYALVQEAIHRGEVRHAGERIHLVFEKDGKWWLAALKRTQAGDELYFLTLHRLSDQSLIRARKKQQGGAGGGRPGGRYPLHGTEAQSNE